MLKMDRSHRIFRTEKNRLTKNVFKMYITDHNTGSSLSHNRKQSLFTKIIESIKGLNYLCNHTDKLNIQKQQRWWKTILVMVILFSVPRKPNVRIIISPGWAMDSPLGKLNALVESSRVPMLSNHVSSMGPSSTNHFFTWDREPIIRAKRCFSEDWLVRSSAMVSQVSVESRNHLDTSPSTHRWLSGFCFPNNCAHIIKKLFSGA